jgi:zinc transporter ZupT
MEAGQMLRSLLYALPGTLFIFLMTTLGAAMVFVLSGKPRPYAQRTTLGFAAGVMTAACVWSLLLPAMDQVQGLPVWLPAAGGLYWVLDFWQDWTRGCLTNIRRVRKGGQTGC